MARPTIQPQPNVPGRGIVASYGLRFWTLVGLVGVAAGLGGAALMELLRLVEHLAWSYRAGEPLEGETFLEAVRHSSAARRVIVLTIGGLVAGGGSAALARLGAGGEVTEAIWLRGSRLPLLASLCRAVQSIVIVGLGASLGREAAPQQTGAAVAAALCDRSKVPDWQRHLLVACGAGAGMAAVYNVPLGGALFALEVLLGTLTLPLVLPALGTTLIATGVAWIALPTHSTYTIPGYSISARLVVWAVLAGPLAGLLAVGYIRLISAAHGLRRGGALGVLAPVLVFAALGCVAIRYPQVLGNGRNVVQLAFVGAIGAGLLAVLLALKPLATSACLATGAPGGLFTPTLATGVLFGGLSGVAWTQLWPGSPTGAYAVIGGAAVLGAAMQGPLAAIVLVIELTHGAVGLMVPVLIAVVEATVLARVARAPSIYSARVSLPASARTQASDSPSDLLPAFLGQAPGPRAADDTAARSDPR